MKARSPDLPAQAAQRFRSMVEQELTRALERAGREMQVAGPETLTLLDELGQVLASGGKRLRPLFCYWGYRAGGGRDDGPVAVAGAAIEMLHTSAFIHDDIVDGAHFRRGQPASFRKLARSRDDPERFGRSAALLAGDLAQALADRLLTGAGASPERTLAAFARFNSMRLEAVSGEFMDLLSSQRSPADEPGARRVAAWKTGSYTVVGPVLIGAELAGAGTEAMSALAAYARPLGEAFQLRDDVLGTFGDPAVTGKDRDNDIREGKRTTLVAKAWQLSGPEERGLLLRSLGRPDLTPAQVQDVRSLLRDSGALAETLALIDSLAGRAKLALGSEGGTLEERAAGALKDLADRVALRPN